MYHVEFTQPLGASLNCIVVGHFCISMDLANDDDDANARVAAADDDLYGTAILFCVVKLN